METETLRQMLVALEPRQIVTLIVLGLSAIVLWGTRMYPWVNVVVATAASIIIVGLLADWGAGLLFGLSSACFLSIGALRQPAQAMLPAKPERKRTGKEFEYDDSEFRVVKLG